MRAAFFGREPVVAECSFADFAETAVDCPERARAYIGRLAEESKETLTRVSATSEVARDLTRLAAIVGGVTLPQQSAPFEIVLAGRTMVGKSTLLDLIAGGDGQRIGDGGQRKTRFVERFEISPSLTLIDTPGVGAQGGESDRAASYEAMAIADLIVWVQDNDALPEQAAHVLRDVAAAGRPVAIVFNCKGSLSFSSERALVRDAERCFRDLDDHRKRPLRILEEYGQAPVLEVAANLALANLMRVMMDPNSSPESTRIAFERVAEQSQSPDILTARTRNPELLRGLARYDGLEVLLGSASDREFGALREFSTCAMVREPLTEAATACSSVGDDATAASTQVVRAALDATRRVRNALDEVREGKEREISDEKSKLLAQDGGISAWVDIHIEHRDFPDASAAKVQHYCEQLNRIIADAAVDTRAAVDAALQSWESDWLLRDSTLKASRPDVKAAHGLWVQQKAKAAVNLLGAGGVVAVAFAVENPLGLLALSLGTAVVGVASLGEWMIKRWLPSAKRKRQGQVTLASEAIRAEVDRLTDDARDALGGLTRDTYHVAEDWELAQGVLAGELQLIVNRARRVSDQLDELVHALDVALYRSLLIRDSRPRLADAIERVDRIPGSCALISFTDYREFTEANLFPPNMPALAAEFESNRPAPAVGASTPVGAALHALRVGRWPNLTVYSDNGEVRIRLQSVSEVTELQSEADWLTVVERATDLRIRVDPKQERQANDRES